MNRKQQDAQILGTPLGTAKTKLYRSLILHFANRCNQRLDCCSICGKKIVEADHLAVTHKDPWRMHGSDAFFDLNNVTLRHTWCSAPQSASRRPNSMTNLVQVTVVDKSNNPLPTFHHEGDLHVAGQPGQEYGIQFRNNTPGKVCVVVSVDGLDVLTSETAKPQAGGHLLSAFGTYTIEGFRKSSSGTTQFSFSSPEVSYAAQTGRPENTGVIGVSVFKEKVERYRDDVFLGRGSNHNMVLNSTMEKGTPRVSSRGDLPKGAVPCGKGGMVGGMYGAQSLGFTETASTVATMDSGSTLGTAFSGHVESHIHKVEFERASIVPDQLSVLYYDTEASLKSRGIIQAVNPRPNPFPATQEYEPGFCQPPGSLTKV